MTDDSLPDFSGKLLLVYVVNSGRGTADGLLMEYAAFQRQGDRLFLTGRIPSVAGVHWIGGAQGAVAWDAVTQYIAFNSRDEYEQRIQDLRVPVRERLRRWWAR